MVKLESCFVVCPTAGTHVGPFSAKLIGANFVAISLSVRAGSMPREVDSGIQLQTASRDENDVLLEP